MVKNLKGCEMRQKNTRAEILFPDKMQQGSTTYLNEAGVL